MAKKCWVLLMGKGYREDGDLQPMKVFLDEALAREQYRLVEEVRETYGGIDGEPHKERMARLAKALAEAPAKYAALGYAEADGESWWEFWEDVELV